MVERAKACVVCAAPQTEAAYSKRQWKKSSPVCNECARKCADAPPAAAQSAVKAVRTKCCAGTCGRSLTEEAFTKRQWKRARPVCLQCPAATASTSTPLVSLPLPAGDGPDGPWPFAVEPLDQCETPLLAYEHVAPLLNLLAQAMGKAPRDLRIYDPYYCAGASTAHLAACGFHSVHHVREDFYARVARRETPEFDVLVTNPPWSGDHIERCLRFCRKSGRPWALLLPNFVYMNERRDHWQAIMRLSYASGAPPADPLCVVPRQPYRYAERFLKSARDVRTRYFAFWCVDLCAHAPGVLTKAFWAAQPPPSAALNGGDEAAKAAWAHGADTVRSVRHLPYHALDARDPRKRTLTASRQKRTADGGKHSKRARPGAAGEVLPNGGRSPSEAS